MKEILEGRVSAQEDNGINQSLRHLSDPSLVLLLSKKFPSRLHIREFKVSEPILIPFI